MHICLNCAHEIIDAEWDCTACGWRPEIIDNFISFSPNLAINNTNFDPTTFSFLASLESEHFWFVARNKLVNWGIRKFFINATNFLEIGCGTGFVLGSIKVSFPKLSVQGSDIYVSSLPYAQSRVGMGAKLFQMDATCMPFKNQFDLIGTFDVLEHITEDTLVLQQMYAALKKGGGVILTVPQHPWLWSRTDDEACHVRRYKIHELQNKLKDAGFKIKVSSSFVFFLFPLMLATRLLSRSKGNIKNELVINKSLNFVLEKILGLEIILINCGIRFPIGGTRFIVATK